MKTTKKEIKEFCKRHGLTEDQFYGREKYEGHLYLNSLTTLPEGCSLTAGDDLDLNSLTTLPEGCSLTAGGDLYLRSLTTLPEGCSLTAGGYLYLRSGRTTTKTKPPQNPIMSWRDGKYILADGVCTEVISKKGRVYTVKNIGSDKVYYLATDGKSTHAHGETIEQAKDDLRFKRIAEKLKNEPIKADTVITIPYYRTITGACETGVKNWMDATFTETEKAGILKKGITAKKLLPILEKKNAYGFEKFRKLVAF